MRNGGGWRRVSDLARNPVMIAHISAMSITQTLIGDCSFVSSLCITAYYEQKFRKKLITPILFPQNRNGQPIYNPSGKYIVKLHLNGCVRKVTVDDRLPVDRRGQYLCSYSNVKNEFWVSIIEKAFLKVNGGYDFPGSTSCEDLFTLTGWIPEKQSFKNLDGQGVERLFNRMVSGMEYGDALITVATQGVEGDGKFERAGLVSGHAYAVLQCKRFKQYKFLQLKNPWARKAWVGRFSSQDRTNWTPEIKKALNYDQWTASHVDNGIFWIEMNDMMKFFSGVFMNWNPDLFPIDISQHIFWPKKQGPVNDSYYMFENPQFTLDLESAEECSVWILLTKHMVNSKREELTKSDFLTLHLYEKVPQWDRLVFTSGGQPRIHKGIYINSPHYLIRLDKKAGTHANTCVISQYEKKHDVSFTIRAFCTSRTKMRFAPVRNPYKGVRELNGKWGKYSNGGPPHNRAFHKNPQYRLIIDRKEMKMRVILRAPHKFAVNLMLYIAVSGRISNEEHYRSRLKVADTGSYRPGICHFDLDLSQGEYILVPSTFEQNNYGAYRLTVKSILPIKLM